MSFLVAATTLILFGQANAVLINYRSLDEVLNEAEAVLMVEIDSVSEPVKKGFFVHIDFDARLLKTLFGSVGSDESISLTYSQGMPQPNRSPLVSGSGREFNLKKGDRVIVLLKANDSGEERLPVLRVEPITQLKAIQQKWKAR
ncbi:MAG: hypothetical protein FWH56_08625 [Betaproteobacteria bacterium]|nr:hypothetical protein [Betaproteobacteria bacterium]